MTWACSWHFLFDSRARYCLITVTALPVVLRLVTKKAFSKSTKCENSLKVMNWNSTPSYYLCFQMYFLLRNRTHCRMTV